jgi:Tfp pilus assembly protein PilO
MNKIYLLIGSIIIFSGIFFIENSYLVSKKPTMIKDLEYEQKNLNEKFITAQILSNSLDRVFKLFNANLAYTKKDEKNQEASIEFLDTLTDIIDDLDINLNSIKPQKSYKKRKNTYIPYDIEISCSFEDFGKLINSLEKHSRLIIINEFRVFSNIDRITSRKSVDDIFKHKIELSISTVTLNKAKG